MTVRRRTESDDAAIVALHNRQEPEMPPMTLSRLRDSLGDTGECWVAADGDTLLGYARFDPAWWTGDPRAFALEMRVDPDRQRVGVGGRLLDALRVRLETRGATQLSAWVRDDSPAALAFAARHGFVQTGQTIQEFHLEIADAPVADADAPAGLKIAALADLPCDDAFLRALQKLWAGGDDAPQELSTWRREVVDGPGLSLETHWVAVDDDRPVGMTFLRRLTETDAENDFTGVAAEWRGRGVASALKRCALAWAKTHGVRRFHTSSEVGNAPMIAVNTRLGYRPGALRHEIRR